MPQLLGARARRELRLQIDRPEGRCMRAWQLQLLCDQVRDDGLDAAHRVDTAASTVLGQHLLVLIVGHARDHRNRRAACIPKTPCGLEEQIGSAERAPACARRRESKLHLKGRRCCRVRCHVDAEGRARSISGLQVAQAQLGLDGGVEQKPDAMGSHRPQPPPTGGELVEGISLDILQRWVGPVEHRAVHHIGMGDYSVCHACKSTCHRQCVARESAYGGTNACRYNQNCRIWRRR